MDLLSGGELILHYADPTGAVIDGSVKNWAIYADPVITSSTTARVYIYLTGDLLVRPSQYSSVVAISGNWSLSKYISNPTSVTTIGVISFSTDQSATQTIQSVCQVGTISESSSVAIRCDSALIRTFNSGQLVSETTVYGSYTDSNLVAVTDNQYSGGEGETDTVPYAMDDSSNLWYQYPNNIDDTYTVVATDTSATTTINIQYNVLNASVYYYRYDGTEQGYSEISLGEKQVGSQYITPAFAYAGSRGTHYEGVIQWVYNQIGYGQSETFTSYPNQTLLVGIWKGTTYTITFVINKPPEAEGTPVPSSISPMAVEYPQSVQLPSVTLSNWDFKGWVENLGSVPVMVYSPTSDVTLTTIFEAKVYTYRFYDYGKSNDEYIQITNYVWGNTLTPPPTSNLPSGIHLVGWFDKATNVKLITSDISTFPENDADFERRYYYEINRDYFGNSTSDVQHGTATVNYPQKYNFPQPSFTLAGYRFSGWVSNVSSIPMPSKTVGYESGIYSYIPEYTYDANYTLIPQAVPSRFYATYTPKSVTSIVFTPAKPNVTVESDGIVTVSVRPTDWVGTDEDIEWEFVPSPGTAINTYCTIEVDSDNKKQLNISGIRGTPAPISLVFKALKDTWKPSSGYVTATAELSITEYTQVKFYVRDDSGQRVPYNNNRIRKYVDDEWITVDTNIFYATDVEVSPNVYQREWVAISAMIDPTHIFPTPPTRTGFSFSGWTDADSTTVDAEHPPEIATECDADWTREYHPKDQDSAYLQLFNFEGTSMMKQIDLGVVQTTTESFNTGVSSTPTPTMTSTNTFITNLSCTESIRVEITRVSPPDWKPEDDDSDDSLIWSNRKWIEEMRGLVDRWQASTDGIKFLFVPHNLEISEVAGQLAGYGENYDLLGYVEEYSSENYLGLRFEQDGHTYVLRGYNGIFESYSDTYSAQNYSKIEVNFTITLGGMKSKYQNWKDAMVLMK